MAKKKKADTKCSRCDGTGQVCNICGDSQTACGCSTEDVEEHIENNEGVEQFDKCEDCGGSGK